jgi:hypothetical protein
MSASHARPYNYEHFTAAEVATEIAITRQLTGPQPGDVAPEFELPGADGVAWRLSEHRGRIVLLHFGSYT